MVKRLVESGFRKGPSDLLLISDSEKEIWFDAEAIRYLTENLEARHGG